MVIISDSREKAGFEYDFSSYGVETIVRKLGCGDYSYQLGEDIITLDRKRNSGELCSNLYKEYKRFSAEMARMELIEHSFILCEFSLQTLLEFPINSGIPPRYHKRVRGSGLGMLKKLETFRERHGVRTLFCENRFEAQQLCYDILRSIYDGTPLDFVDNYALGENYDGTL